MNGIIIRAGNRRDIPFIHKLIVELAIYEKAPDEVEVSLNDLERDAFDSNPLFRFIVAEQDNEIMGCAIFCYKYSTWKGKCIYLEDIIVSEQHRRKGIGKLLMDEVISISKKEKVKRLMWQVLDWNEPAIEFYKSYNAIIEPEWVNCKLIEGQY